MLLRILRCCARRCVASNLNEKSFCLGWFSVWVICTLVDCRSSQIGSAHVLRCSATVPRCLAPLLRYQAVWSPPVFTACVCDLCRVRVLVRLSHPRPPDRSQHGCTVGVLPGPTRVLPMPRQCGIGRRAPTRAVLSCAALWCLVVRRPRRRVDCLVLTFCSVSSRTPPRHGHGCGPVDLEKNFAPLVAHRTR